MNNIIDERLTFLEKSKASHFNITEMLAGQIGVMNIYGFMVLKRSISLVFGFTASIRNKNFLCAVPLIRLQIDNLLRFGAAFLVQNQSQFVVDVFEGKEVGKLKDRSGKRMTDAYLQDILAPDYPWLKEVYKHSSGYIHLSEKHFHNTLRADKDGREGVLNIYIGPDDKMVSDDVYEAAIEDMILVTHSLLTFVGNWALGANKA